MGPAWEVRKLNVERVRNGLGESAGRSRADSTGPTPVEAVPTVTTVLHEADIELLAVNVTV